MAQTQDELAERIELLVRERRRTQALAAILRFLRRNLRSPRGRLQVCRWYYRLGAYEAGYRLIAPRIARPSAARESAELTREFAWAAFFLHMLGATEFARKIVRELDPKDRESLWLVGTIHYTGYDFERGLRCFDRMQRAPADPQFTPYRMKLAEVAVCDCLHGLGRSKEALARLKKIVARADERLLIGILHQSEGEYRLGLRQWKPALAALEKARPFYPDGDRSPDRAFLCKWLGYAYAANGRMDEARKMFDQARDLLSDPEYRDEMLLDCLALQAEAGLASPEERELLESFPGLAEGFHRAPSSGGKRTIGSGERGVVYLGREEVHLDGRRFVSVSREHRLAALVALCGPRGLALVRAKTLLWPDDYASYLQLGGRLRRLLTELKQKYRLGFEVRQGRIHFADGASRFRVELGGSAGELTYFEGRESFTLAEFARHYSLSEGYARAFLRGSETRGRIRKVRAGLYAVASRE